MGNYSVEKKLGASEANVLTGLEKRSIQHSPDDRICPFRMAKDWSYANKEFREVLKMSLDEKGYREQALGKWATYAGGCYYAFADDNIMTEEYKVDANLPILFGFDFNVDWYSIVAVQYKDDMFHVFDEIRLANSNKIVTVHAQTRCRPMNIPIL